MAVSLVQFNGFLKQMRQHSISMEAEIALEKTFSYFWPVGTNSEEFSKGKDA
jgi:hypothetical protein